MNTHQHPGILPVPHPTIPDQWTVTVDGSERTITREGPGFIAWIGSRDLHWSFAGALRSCVEDIEHQASRTVTLPVPLSDDERWLLQFSDADDASERMARGTR